MIQFTKSYKTSDNQLFGSVEEAKIHELELVIAKINPTHGVSPENVDAIATMIMNNKDIILDILTTTPNSKPKARAIHGGTKKRNKTPDVLLGGIVGVGAIPATNA